MYVVKKKKGKIGVYNLKNLHNHEDKRKKGKKRKANYVDQYFGIILKPEDNLPKNLGPSLFTLSCRYEEQNGQYPNRYATPYLHDIY